MFGIKILLFFIGIFSPALTLPYFSHFMQFQDYDIDPFGASDDIVFDGPADRPSYIPGGMNQINLPAMIPTTTGRPISSTTPALSTTTTPSPEFSACIRNCQVTIEYNPVCGSDNQVYNNPGMLRCSKTCGKNVQIRNTGRCSSASTRG